MNLDSARPSRSWLPRDQASSHLLKSWASGILAPGAPGVLKTCQEGSQFPSSTHPWATGSAPPPPHHITALSCLSPTALPSSPHSPPRPGILHGRCLCSRRRALRKSMVVRSLGTLLAESAVERTWTLGPARPQSKCKLYHRLAWGPWARRPSLSCLITKMGPRIIHLRDVS